MPAGASRAFARNNMELNDAARRLPDKARKRMDKNQRAKADCCIAIAGAPTRCVNSYAAEELRQRRSSLGKYFAGKIKRCYLTLNR